jgi:hypothetical protein
MTMTETKRFAALCILRGPSIICPRHQWLLPTATIPARTSSNRGTSNEHNLDRGKTVDKSYVSFLDTEGTMESRR